MRKIIIGVMGPGDTATPTDLKNAYELGNAIAGQGWVLLTGGRNVGVMEAASQGAKAAGGLTLGILPNETSKGVSEAVDIAIFTDMGNARNNVNVLSSDLIIACGIGTGTVSEIALGLKGGKTVIVLNEDPESQRFFQRLSPQQVLVASDVAEAIALTHRKLR